MLFNGIPFYLAVFFGKSYSTLQGLAQSSMNYRSNDNHTFKVNQYYELYILKNDAD